MADRLTRRELQCVRLAGEGLSNKVIRARLDIGSDRTVERHLSNAYAKLGTSDRYAAAELVRRNYADTPIPIVPADEPRFDPQVSAAIPDRSSDGNRQVGPLYAAYLALGRWRTPPGGFARVVMILASAIIVIMMVGMLFSIASIVEGFRR